MKWVLKTSRIIVDTDKGKSVFRSLADCPPDVKRRVRETVPGPDACTILIANKEAYEAIRPPARTLDALPDEEAPRPRADLPRWQVRALWLLAAVATLVSLLAWAMHSG